MSVLAIRRSQEAQESARREAREPPEARGLKRGEVAMLVATRSDGALHDTRFNELARFLNAGDLLVVNISATIPAALPARLGDQQVELHLSTPAADGNWVVELRTADLQPLRPAPIGARLDLPADAHADLLWQYEGSERLCVARLFLTAPFDEYLGRHGRPIRYGYVERSWPLDAYQNVFALEPGSAEMPSAGRPFTTELVTELVAGGVLFAPLTLHTGVSSLDRDEAPYPERYRVPVGTARLVNAVRSWGGRVIAIGTTVVRALETVARVDSGVDPGEGWTDLIVTPERGLRAIDGLLTGWHEPESSHLELLEAAAGGDLLQRSYAAAHAYGYVWHEFGDSHLILP